MGWVISGSIQGDVDGFGLEKVRDDLHQLQLLDRAQPFRLRLGEEDELCDDFENKFCLFGRQGC